MKYLRQFWNWLFNSNPNNKQNKYESFGEGVNKISYTETEVKLDISQEEYDSAMAHLELDKERYKAIQECDGCEENVFVLKLNGEDIGYYPNLNRLAIKNKFSSSSVYHYWHTKPIGKLYMGKYEIKNLK